MQNVYWYIGESPAKLTNFVDIGLLDFVRKYNIQGRYKHCH